MYIILIQRALTNNRFLKVSIDILAHLLLITFRKKKKLTASMIPNEIQMKGNLLGKTAKQMLSTRK